MEECYILAFDLGTTFAKIGIVNLNGEIEEIISFPSKIIFTKDKGVEQDPEEWWQIFLKGSKRLLDKYPNIKQKIKCIAITTHWSGTVCIDKNLNPLRNAIIWMDSRGAEIIKNRIGNYPSIHGYNILKLWNFIRFTGGAPGLSGKDSISHILFIKEKEKEIYKEVYKFLEPKDYLNLKLTGKIFSSYDTITLHWITDNRNIHNIKYEPKLLKLFNLYREKFPDLIKPGSIIGTILPHVSKELDLPSDVLVTSGAPDLQSATLGAGSIHDFDCYIYIGTSSWISCHTSYKKTDLLHNIATLPSAVPGKYFIANEQEIAGYSLTYLKENIFFPKDDLISQNSNEENINVYEKFDQIAAKIPPGSEGLIFTPWLAGERTPVENSFIRGGFFNLSLNTTRSHLIRSVMEGVAFNSKWLFYYIEKFINKKIQKLTFIGGGAKSDIWSQILADVLNVKILQVKDPFSVNLKGVALSALASIGKMKWEEIPKAIKIKSEYIPQENNVKIYDSMFKEFLEIYKKNYKIYKRLNKNYEY